MVAITDHEAEQSRRRTRPGKQPVVFVHGLWLLPSSWDRWRRCSRRPATRRSRPGWPDDPDTVAEANRHPEVFAHKSIGQIADHFDDVIGELDQQAGHRRPLVRRAAHPDPRRPRAVGGVGRHRSGAVPRRAAAADLGAASRRRRCSRNPANRHRAVPLTYEQFRYAFANAVSEDEAKELYDTFAVPGSGAPLFQAATANLNPWTEARSTPRTPTAVRCSSLDGELDHTVPVGHRQRVLQAAEAQRRASPRSSRSRAVATRSTSTTAGATSPTSALEFVQRFVQP